MAAIKCIILESWTRINPDLGIYESRSVYVTDEAGNPVIYDSLTEARAEIRSNGYRIGNSDRAHDPETTDINGTRHESWIQIIREGSAEYAEAIEQAQQDAAEPEQRAELLASIEDPTTREWITAEAIAHDWSAEETAEAIMFFRNIRTANAAALALLDAYAAVIGEYPEEYDPESIAAYRVARDEIAGSHIRATAEELEIVADMVEAIADDVRDTIAERLEFATRPADLGAYQSDYCTFEPAREIYQRAELVAYLGDYVDDYDVDAIEAEATEYDPKTSRTYWKRGINLWEVCERHEIAAYYPATA